MANLIRTAKSGSDWARNDLRSYNIEVTIMREMEFFREEVNDPLDRMSSTFLQYEFIPGVPFPENVERLVPYLDMASKTILGQESAVDDFARELLRSMGFESSGRIIRNRYSLKFIVSGGQTTAQTDVCIISLNNDTLLLVQEDKRIENPKDPEPQVIAEAIAAFQENNKIRRQSGIKELDEMVFPCITMIGTSPTFYLVPVTKELSECVADGRYPNTKTIVRCHIPKVPRRTSEGMKPVENRKKILQCFEAFKKFVDELEECLKVVF